MLLSELFGFLFIILGCSMGINFFYSFYYPEYFMVPPIMAVICMCQTVRADPGYIKVKIEKPERPTTMQLGFIKNFSKWGWIKPPRSHGSSWSKKVVFDFDHHCYWVGNDIGLYNYRFFLQFLGWLCLGSFIALCETFRFFVNCGAYRDTFSCKMIYQHTRHIVPLYFVSMFGFFLTLNLLGEAARRFRRGCSYIDYQQGVIVPKEKNYHFRLFFGSGIPVLYQLFPMWNSLNIYRRADSLEKNCIQYFKRNDIKVVYKYD
jgi:hypothetical protein